MGIRTGLCPRCKIVLTQSNCGPVIWKNGAGLCRNCDLGRIKDYQQRNPEKVKEWQFKTDSKYRESRNRKAAIFKTTIRGRFIHLTGRLRKENSLSTDLLYSINFYSELVKEQQCHYCLGSLSPTGHGLDRIDNQFGHLCYNVVPCCKGCNQKKSNDTSYEEMMMLAPVLREIRKRREEKRWQQSQ